MNLRVPKGGAVRDFYLKSYDYPWTIIIAKIHEDAHPANLTKSGQITVICTHDKSVSWPNQRSEALAVAALEQGGVVALAFADVADSMACARRLKGGAQ